MLERYRQYCNFTRRACSASAGGKLQAAGHKPPWAGVQRDIIAIMPRHSRKAGPSRGRYPRFQWARARLFAGFGQQVFPSLKSILSPFPCVLCLPDYFLTSRIKIKINGLPARNKGIIKPPFHFYGKTVFFALGFLEVAG